MVRPFCVKLARQDGLDKRALSRISGDINYPRPPAHWWGEAKAGKTDLGCHRCLWILNCRSLDHGQRQGLGRVPCINLSGNSPHFRGTM